MPYYISRLVEGNAGDGQVGGRGKFRSSGVKGMGRYGSSWREVRKRLQLSWSCFDARRGIKITDVTSCCELRRSCSLKSAIIDVHHGPTEPSIFACRWYSWVFQQHPSTFCLQRCRRPTNSLVVYSAPTSWIKEDNANRHRRHQSTLCFGRSLASDCHPAKLCGWPSTHCFGESLEHIIVTSPGRFTSTIWSKS